ncbi:hypothetical protein AKJ47_01030 [candidate division MSBL1 archaeon SCGC-AAA261G05]|uniref:Uncharacterized protein n=2 Tax=candidate division MSBL1 TaxID=215777 RepID=A0A133V269_9EURY|nr:hypothetical protein AKJ42_00320 [candidate division MSBL1 archaeon SCGC-AAA261C02]KXB04017.1 hypothetical protein AKJ47_01030 [candidate division MSBL1 archaeon SCGC-AAA261G05]
MFDQNTLSSRSILIVLISIFVLSTLLPGQAHAADDNGEEEGPFWGQPWWRIGLSLGASMFAMVCISYATIDLGIENDGFWIVNFLALLLILMGVFTAGINGANPFFWLSIIMALCLFAVIFSALIVMYFSQRI